MRDGSWNKLKVGGVDGEKIEGILNSGVDMSHENSKSAAENERLNMLKFISL